MAQDFSLRFPILTINKTEPLLAKDDRVFSYSIKAATEDGTILNLYENKGLDLSKYIGRKMECLLEITKGKFEYKAPKNGTVLKYQWIKRVFEFFPELIEMHADLHKSNIAEQEIKSKEFKDSATHLVENWGLNGLNMYIYQAKPVFNSALGVFLLNEYEFEEDIESLELGQEVYIRIDELYLRGIKPCEPLENKRPKRQISKPKEEPKQQPPEPPKSTSKTKPWFDND